MKKIFLVALLLSVTPLIFAQEKIEWVDIDNIWKEANEYENKGEYEKALEELSKIPVNDSGYISSLTSKSYYQVNNEQYKEAIATAEEGLKSNYQNFHYYFMLNKIAGLLGLKDYDKSLLALDEGLKRYPKNYKLYYNKGVCYEGLKKYEKAAEMYKKSITYNPFYAKNHLSLAILCYNEHLITQTMMCLNMYLLCNPDGSGSFNVLNSFNNMVKSKNDKKKHPGVTIDKDDNSFEEIDLIIDNYAALNKKYKISNKIQIPLVKQNHAMIEKLKDYEGNGGFWDKNYVPFFKWVDENELFNPFAYTISFSIENEKYKAIVNKNISKIKEFLPKYHAKWAEIVGKNKVIINGKKTDVQYLYNGSKIEGYGPYINKKTTGQWKVFDGKGRLSSEGTFDDEGKKHGKWTWYKKGVVEEKGEYEHGTLINEYLVYHDNGTLNIKANYKDGKLDGLYKKYNTYGALIESLNYVEGKYDGEYLSYYGLGEGYLEYKIFYVKGKAEGKVIQYYVDGKVKTEMNFKENKKEGEWISYYQNGQIDTKKNYVNNMLSGDYIEYHLNGNLYQQGKCEEGDYIDEWKSYYNDNTLAKEFSYSKGQLNGVYNKYTRNGVLNYEFTYKKGELIAYRYFNAQKEIIKEEKKKGGEFFYEGYTLNGNITTEGLYDVSGGKEGVWKFYSDNNVLETEETYRESQMQDFSINYHENGTIKNKKTYINDTLEGYYVSFYSNQQMNQQGWYHKGKWSGEWITYYPDGTLKRKEYYNNGVAYGSVEDYAGNGKPASIFFYFKDDLKTESYYNASGELIEEIDTDIDSVEYVLQNKYVNGNINNFYKMRYDKKHGQAFSNYFSGKKYSEGNYFNGEKNGSWKWYHENGKLYKEGSYVDGNKDGEWKTYHENGEVDKKSNYEYGASIGTEKTYNEKGILTQTRTFKSDKVHGEINFYSEEGKLQLTRYYNYGVLIGYSYLDKNGKQKPMIPLDNETGKIEAFFDNGKPSRTMEVRHGAFINAYNEYYYNGQVFEAQTYKDGEREGAVKAYYADGTLMSETPYLLGNMHGEVKEYHSNGKLKEVSTYFNGDINGDNKYYNKMGELIKEKTYFNGEVFSEKIYK